MESTELYATGQIISIDGHDFRIISIHPDYIVLSDLMKRSSAGLAVLSDLASLNEGVLAGRITVRDDGENSVVDYSLMSERDRQAYKKRVELVHVVRSKFGPDYLGLYDRRSHEVKEFIAKSGFSHTSFWRAVTQYLQSSMRDSALQAG